MELKEVLKAVEAKETNWKKKVQDLSEKLPEDVIDTLGVIGRAKSKKTQTYLDSLNLINTKVSNLESNLFIEVDMERIEDKSKALSYIGIEVADALKAIPAPIEEKAVQAVQEPVQETTVEQITEEQYIAETFEAKPTLWQRIKQSKLGRAIKTIMSIRIVVDNSNALPEGRGEN